MWFDVFKQYKAEVEDQLNKKIKALRSDRGGEYVFPFEESCAEHGVLHLITTPYSPQSNGITDRKIKLLKKWWMPYPGLPDNFLGRSYSFGKSYFK